MFSALAYKEWLKTRWFLLGTAAIGFAAVITIMLKLGAFFEFNSASSFWTYVVFKKYLYYGSFKYVPLISAFIIAGAQYVPEFTNYKLKLTLHLPVRESKLLFYMVGYGTMLLFLLDLIFMFSLVLISAAYFPSEIVLSMVFTVLPWMLAGFSAYFFTAATLIEPLWSRRILLAVFGYGFFSQLLLSAGYLAYTNSLVYFAVFVLLQYSLIFLSGFRFKRGAR